MTLQVSRHAYRKGVYENVVINFNNKYLIVCHQRLFVSCVAKCGEDGRGLNNIMR